jgi:hypothetical protein
MEQWVRVQNERDRQVLAWLRVQVGDAAIIAVAQSYASPGKPYLSTVCRVLRVTPPRFVVARDATGEVGERYLASIYQILQRPRSAARAIL